MATDNDPRENVFIQTDTSERPGSSIGSEEDPFGFMPLKPDGRATTLEQPNKSSSERTPDSRTTKP